MKTKLIEVTWAQSERLAQAMQILVQQCSLPPVLESVYWEQVELLQKIRNINSEFQKEASEARFKEMTSAKKDSN